MHISDEQVKRYLKRRLDEIEELKKSLITNDYEVPTNIGHRLKGNGVTFGFPQISEVGKKIENAALVKNKLELLNALEEFVSIVHDNLNLIK